MKVVSMCSQFKDVNISMTPLSRMWQGCKAFHNEFHGLFLLQVSQSSFEVSWIYNFYVSNNEWGGEGAQIFASTVTMYE